MDKILKDYLFAKRYLVSDEPGEGENVFETLFALGRLLGIRITKGHELLRASMIAYAGKQLGTHVPAPFYKGFPETVRALSPDQLLYDQIVHYVHTYGLGLFNEPGHSVFEEDFCRLAFAEKTEPKDFAVIDEATANALIRESCEDLLQGTRPLSDSQFEVVKTAISQGLFVPAKCASKDTAVRLLLAFRDPAYTKFLALPDFIRLADELQYQGYEKNRPRVPVGCGIVDEDGYATRFCQPGFVADSYRPCLAEETDEDDILSEERKPKTGLYKLNLKNVDRKFLTKALDAFLEGEIKEAAVVACFEKKALWSGILHHLHYRPKNEAAEAFVRQMRGSENLSVSSRFEAHMANGDVAGAAKELGSGAAVLRHLQYLLSRCKSGEEAAEVLNTLDSGNALVLLQLYYKYAGNGEDTLRTFRFTKHNLLKVHQETEEEAARRKSRLTPALRRMVEVRIREMLYEALKNRLGKVYVDPEMARIAVPIQENASSGGFGILPKGSRLPLPEGKKVRAFTYWEKVNDIDLSVIGMGGGRQVEFSWRSMAGRQSKAITYSGDQTSGYNGGSEFFDVDLVEFEKQWPEIEYLVFCDNVYSGLNFAECICRAGYMMRDKKDSGKVFEPKTVASSFTINCESTFAYLFAIDIRNREFIWLNLTKSGTQIIAGAEDLSFLLDYFGRAKIFNLYDLFAAMAAERVDDPSEADVIVSDKPLPEDCVATQIRSCDVDKVLALL